VDKRLIHLLDSLDASERERAIKAMARSGDPAYIQYLNVVIKIDPDPNLRALATKAVQYIKQQSGETRDTQEVAARTTPKRVEVSAADERRAASLLDRAMELSTRHQDEAARELVVKAYRLDPNIRLDSYKRGIVGTVMGMGANEAFDLLDEQLAAPFDRTKRKASGVGTQEDDGNWGSAVLDLLIYGAVTAASAILIYFLIVQVGRPILQEAAQSMAVASAESGEINFSTDFDPSVVNEAINGLISAGLVLVLIYAGLTALGNMAVAFVGSVLIHLSAKLIGGEGSLARLLNKTVSLYTIFYVITVVLGVAGAVVWIGQLASLVEANAVTTTTTMDGTISFEAEIVDLSPLSGSSFAFGLISFVLALVFIIVLVGRIAEAYRFSWMRGCSAYLLSLFFSSAVSACFVCLVLPVLASVLGSLF
jgi:hypothetical protein